MRLVLAILCACFFYSASFAQINPDSDMLGVYFDQEGFNCSIIVGPSIPFYAYVTITRPSAAEVHGLEFSYSLLSNGAPGTLFRLANILPDGAVDLGTNTDLMGGDYVVGLASPLPATASVEFVTWQFMLLSPQTVEIYLGPSTVESIQDGLPAYEIGGSIQPLAIGYGSGYPVAYINDWCIPVEAETFGDVKCLYR